MERREKPLRFLLCPCIHRVIICCLSSKHILHENHQFKIQHTHLLTPILSILFFQTSYLIFFSPSTHTHIQPTKHTPLSHSLYHTGTSTTSPTLSAPNSPEATAASNAKKTNVVRKSPPLKLSLWSTFTKKQPRGKICKCYLNRMDGW